MINNLPAIDLCQCTYTNEELTKFLSFTKVDKACGSEDEILFRLHNEIEGLPSNMNINKHCHFSYLNDFLLGTSQLGMGMV